MRARSGLRVAVAVAAAVPAACSAPGQATHLSGPGPAGSTARAASASYVTCRSALVKVVQPERSSSGEASLYLELLPKHRSRCSVSGFVRVAGSGTGHVLVRYGGDPAMHSPPSARYELSHAVPGFFGVGWHTKPSPGSPDRCGSLRRLVVWTSAGSRHAVAVPQSRVCAAFVNKPYVAVSTVQTRGHFPAANP